MFIFLLSYTLDIQ